MLLGTVAVAIGGLASAAAAQPPAPPEPGSAAIAAAREEVGLPSGKNSLVLSVGPSFNVTQFRIRNEASRSRNLAPVGISVAASYGRSLGHGLELGLWARYSEQPNYDRSSTVNRAAQLVSVYPWLGWRLPVNPRFGAFAGAGLGYNLFYDPTLAALGAGFSNLQHGLTVALRLGLYLRLSPRHALSLSLMDLEIQGLPARVRLPGVAYVTDLGWWVRF